MQHYPSFLRKKLTKMRKEYPKIRKDGRKLTKLSEEMHSKPNFHRTMRKLYRKIPKKRLLTPTIEKEKIIKQMIIQKQTYIHIVKNGKGLKGKTKSKTTGGPCHVQPQLERTRQARTNVYLGSSPLSDHVGI